MYYVQESFDRKIRKLGEIRCSENEGCWRSGEHDRACLLSVDEVPLLLLLAVEDCVGDEGDSEEEPDCEFGPGDAFETLVDRAVHVEG